MNSKDLNNSIKKVNKWFDKKTKFLSIKTRPYNSPIIFSSVIRKVLNTNGRVLYVWCNNERERLSRRKKEYYNIFIQEEDRGSCNKNIKFVVANEVADVKEEFDLVIFDDITIFSQISKDYSRELIEEVYWRSKKIIFYTAEDVFPIGEKITIPFLLNKLPMIEPRFIATRIKLEEDIPLALYEYFKWFKENNKKTLILTPTEEKLNKVYNNYHNLLKEEIRIVKYMKKQSFSFIEDILESYDGSLFIISNNIGEYINQIDNLNIVILFSDDILYNYKKIIYLCGALKVKNEFLPEILLVSREVSNQMDIAKDMARGFNRTLWERKILKK